MTFTEMAIVAKSNQWHVNNAVLYTYLEEARREWYHFCKVRNFEAVLVNISVNYKREVFDKNKLFIRTSIERVGNTSFTLLQQVFDDQDLISISAEAVLVAINSQTRTKIPVPEAVCNLLHQDSVLEVRSSMETK